jgi:hypothetical protein
MDDGDDSHSHDDDVIIGCSSVCWVSKYVNVGERLLRKSSWM